MTTLREMIEAAWSAGYDVADANGGMVNDGDTNDPLHPQMDAEGEWGQLYGEDAPTLAEEMPNSSYDLSEYDQSLIVAEIEGDGYTYYVIAEHPLSWDAMAALMAATI